MDFGNGGHAFLSPTDGHMHSKNAQSVCNSSFSTSGEIVTALHFSDSNGFGQRRLQNLSQSHEGVDFMIQYSEPWGLHSHLCSMHASHIYSIFSNPPIKCSVVPNVDLRIAKVIPNEYILKIVKQSDAQV